jgi:hypothetical protein
LSEAGGVVTQQTGKVNSAAGFTSDQGGQNGQALQIADNPDLSTGRVGFTVAGWIYIASKGITGGGVLAGKGGGEGGPNMEYALSHEFTTFDRFVFQVGNGTNSILAIANSFGSPATNTWHFVVGWCDGSNLYIQVNNGAINQTAFTGVPLDDNHNFTIGCHDNFSGCLKGRVDEVGFWKRALTAEERATLYNKGYGCTYPFTSCYDEFVFLPVVQKPRPGLFGRVTYNGHPAPGVFLELRFYNGSVWSTMASTTTASDGSYAFLGIPSLRPGQEYYVRYRNFAGTPGRLWVWSTRELTTYSADSTVAIGDFDIADIYLVSPPPGAAVSLPYTFQWIRRPATPSDSYEFDIYDPTDGDPYGYTSPLGYVSGYTVTGLPAGFSSGVPYAWEIWVHNPDGGVGISYDTRFVTFTNLGFQAISGLAAVEARLLRTSQRVNDFPER